jgi:predicted Abi (CAAX) family protease
MARAQELNLQALKKWQSCADRNGHSTLASIFVRSRSEIRRLRPTSKLPGVRQAISLVSMAGEQVGDRDERVCTVNDRLRRWGRAAAASIKRLVLRTVPYLKVALAMGVAVGPWAFASQSDGGIGLMELGLLLAVVFTPAITTPARFYVVVAASGLFFAFLYGVGVAAQGRYAPQPWVRLLDVAGST